MVNLSEYDILNAIKRSDLDTLRYLYKDLYPEVLNFIISHKGSREDAQDIFQDAMVLLFLKTRSDIPELTCSFRTYFFSVVKFLWYNEFRRRNRFAASPAAPDELPDIHSDIFEAFLLMEKRKLVMQHFDAMPPECRKIIRMHLDGISFERIAAVMGYNSVQYTRNRKLVCKEKLVRSIWNNSRFKELINEAYAENTKVPRW
jgi:RNA polymerase sigma factor (sigma-70 family)